MGEKAEVNVIDIEDARLVGEPRDPGVPGISGLDEPDAGSESAEALPVGSLDLTFDPRAFTRHADKAGMWMRPSPPKVRPRRNWRPFWLAMAVLALGMLEASLIIWRTGWRP